MRVELILLALFISETPQPIPARLSGRATDANDLISRSIYAGQGMTPVFYVNSYRHFALSSLLFAFGLLSCIVALVWY